MKLLKFDLSIKNQQKISVLLRFLLALVLIYLGLQHIFDPVSFQKTLQLPANRGIFFSWLYTFILDNEIIFLISKYLVGLIELIFGILLIVGLFIRGVAIITSIVLIFILVSLIPSWILIIIHSFSLAFSLPLIFLNLNLFVPFEKYLPESLLILHKKV